MDNHLKMDLESNSKEVSEPKTRLPVFPFSRDNQLNTDLESGSNGGYGDLEECVEEEATDLNATRKMKPARPLDYLPGHPRVKLKDTSSVFRFLMRDLCHEDLERVASRLWWMSKQDKRSISP